MSSMPFGHVIADCADESDSFDPVLVFRDRYI